MTVDAAESALRRVPGVLYVANSRLDGSVVMHVLAEPTADTSALRKQATAICDSHLASPFALEVASAARRSRIQLMEVEVAADAEVVVHLGHAGLSRSGRSTGIDPTAAAEATFDALANLGAPVPFRVEAAALFEHPLGDGVMVVLGSEATSPRYGVASGDNAVQAAARATLHALNRYLATQYLADGDRA